VAGGCPIKTKYHDGNTLLHIAALLGIVDENWLPELIITTSTGTGAVADAGGEAGVVPPMPRPAVPGALAPVPPGQVKLSVPSSTLRFDRLC